MSRHIWASVAGGLLTTGVVWWWLSRPKAASPMTVVSGFEALPATMGSLERIADALEHIAGASYVSFDASPIDADIDMGPGVGPVREAPKKEEKKDGKKDDKGESISLGPSMTSASSKPVEEDQGASMTTVTENALPSKPRRPSVKMDLGYARQKLVEAREEPLQGSFATESRADAAPVQEKDERTMTSSQEYSQEAAPRRPVLVRASAQMERPSPAIRQVPKARFK